METYTFDHDIIVFCLTAKSFPAGLPEVYDKLHSLYPPGNGRTYFGISYPDGKGSIVYKAAVQLNGQDEEPTDAFETFVIRKGTYLAKDIRNFMDDTTQIGRVFQEMIVQPGIDPKGYCLEMYLNPTDVRCMVPLK